MVHSAAKAGRLIGVVLMILLCGVVPQAHASAPQSQTHASAPQPQPHASAPQPQEYPASFADLAQKLLPSVVNISTLQVVNTGAPNLEMPQFPPGSPFEEFFKDFMEQQQQQGRPRRAAALGSGFIIDATKGYIVTNNHVIQDAEEITVILQDDTNLPAKVIGRDEKTDLALLKVDPQGHTLVAVPWGDSDVMRVGDWVLAIGNPYGLGGTVTQGIISARARNINSGPYDDYLQTDASINRGNSGGPMFNLKGEVVGINTAIFSPSGGSIGIGFAVPSAIARNVVDQILEYGRTKRGWLGVRVQAVTPEIADSLGFGQPRGALVSGTTAKGPAEQAGLKTGDIILTFDGKPVNEMRQLPRMVADTPVGKEVALTFWRSGETKTVTLKVAELEQAEDDGLVDTGSAEDAAPDAPGGQEKVYGLSVTPLTRALRRQYDINENTQGLLVVSVDPESPAADRDLEPGDVIVEAAQTEIKTAAALQAKAEEVRKSGRKSLFLLVERKGDLRFVALPLEAPKGEQE